MIMINSKMKKIIFSLTVALFWALVSASSPFMTTMPTGHEFKIVSFNVWGLLISNDRRTRIDGIGRYFAGLPIEPGHPDAVDVLALQELWMADDYQRLKSLLATRFPHSHYFKSGVVGSGLAVFSRWPIEEVWWHPYRIQGRPERIFDGDFYAGKGIGACRIRHPSAGTIDVFDTHLISNYSPKNYDKDRYKIHRATQMYELVRHVDRTSDPRHFTIVLGDMNAQPFEDGYTSLLASKNLYTSYRPGLRNTWEDIPNASNKNTFNLPGNSYHSTNMPTQQIDHIMYVPDGRIICKAMRIFLNERIPQSRDDSYYNNAWFGNMRRNPSYSDHAALMATFILNPYATTFLNNPEAARRQPVHATTRKLVNLVENELWHLDRQRLGFKIGAGLFGVFTAIFFIVGVLLIRIHVTNYLRHHRRGSNRPRASQPTLLSDSDSITSATTSSSLRQTPKPAAEEDENESENSSSSAWWYRIPVYWSVSAAFALAVFSGLLCQWMSFMSALFLPTLMNAFHEFRMEWTLWLSKAVLN